MTRTAASSDAHSATGRGLDLTSASTVALLLAVLACGPARSSPVDRQAEAATCALAAGHYRTVTAVTGPDAISLDDGTEVKLAGLIGASGFDTTMAPAEWPPEQQATRALSDLVLGKRVSVHAVTPHTDRYRRLVAHVFVESDDQPRWVQGKLLADGHARAYAQAEAYVCADQLLAHEREARQSRSGIWASAAYFERAAYRTRELMRLRGTFQIVSGRVRKVSEVKSAIYLNFGTDWHSDFTAGIRLGKGATWEAAFTEMVRGLEGRRVRVRGWIDRRNGPYVEIGHPSEIEILDVREPRTAATPAASAGPNEKRPEP